MEHRLPKIDHCYFSIVVNPSLQAKEMIMKHCGRGLTVVFLLTFVFIFAAYAQVNTADITGRVTDEQGRVVPGATVTAPKKAIGVSRWGKRGEAVKYTITN